MYVIIHIQWITGGPCRCQTRYSEAVKVLAYVIMSKNQARARDFDRLPDCRKLQAAVSLIVRDAALIILRRILDNGKFA